MTPPILSIESLAVTRRGFRLYIEKLHLRSGRLLCVAGPNGSGKSTLLNCITGLLLPDSGNVAVIGRPMTKNLREVKANIGYVPDDEDWFIRELNAREYLRLLSKVHATDLQDQIQSRITDLAQKLYFSNLDTPLDELSHGNKKKVQLIAGLMHSPKLIVIDELRNGLDPLTIMAAEQILRDETARGACIIAATHDLWWAERIADEVLILNEGHVCLHQTTVSICKQYGNLEKAFMRQVSASTQAS